MVVCSSSFLFCVLSLFLEVTNTYLVYITVALKPNDDTNKVVKKRGRPSTKTSPTKKAAAPAESSDENQGAADIKGEGSDTD